MEDNMMTAAQYARQKLMEAKANIETFPEVEVYFITKTAKDGEVVRANVRAKVSYDYDWEMDYATINAIVEMEPNLVQECKVILAKQGDKKLCWIKATDQDGVWRTRDITDMDIRLMTKVCPKCSGHGKLSWGVVTNGKNGDRGCFACNGRGY